MKDKLQQAKESKNSYEAKRKQKVEAITFQKDKALKELKE